MGIVSQAKSAIPGVEGSAEGKYQQSSGFSHLYYPLNIGDEMFTNTIRFEAGRVKYTEDEVTVNTEKTTDAKVELYMPQNIEEENSRDWSEAEVGFFGQKMASKAANTDLSSMSEIMKSANELKGDIAKNIKNQALKGGYNLLGQAVGSENAASAALARTGNGGKAIDPKLEMLFQGIGFRDFQFSFAMYPRSEQEAKMIIDIINFFKWRSAPSFDENKFFFNWPDIFDIRFKDTGYLFDFEPCALTSVSVNYTPEGIWAEMKNGSFVGVEMSLSFTELNIKTREDIEEEQEKSKADRLLTNASNQ